MIMTVRGLLVVLLVALAAMLHARPAQGDAKVPGRAGPSAQAYKVASADPLSWFDVADGEASAARPRGTLLFVWSERAAGPVLVEWDIGTKSVLRKVPLQLPPHYDQLQMSRCFRDLWIVASSARPGNPVWLMRFYADTLVKRSSMSLGVGSEASVDADDYVAGVSFMSGTDRRTVALVSAATDAEKPLIAAPTFTSVSWMQPFRPVVIVGRVYASIPTRSGPFVVGYDINGRQIGRFDPADGAWGTAFGALASYRDHVFVRSQLGVYELTTSLALVRRHPLTGASQIAIQPLAGGVVDDTGRFGPSIGALAPVPSALPQGATVLGLAWTPRHALAAARDGSDLWVWILETAGLP